MAQLVSRSDIGRRSAWFTLMFALVAMLAASTCHAARRALTVFAQMYTPEIVTGDNPKPLHEFTKLARMWEKLHPGVKVEFIKQPVGEYRTWMITQFRGGTAPDIMWGPATWVNQDAKYGWTVDLNPYVNKPNKYILGNKRWIDIFYQAATDTRRGSDGSLRTLPIDQVETGIFYNKDIFRKLNLKTPVTWPEFMEVCRELDEAGYTPFLIKASAQMGILNWAKEILHDQLWDQKLQQIDIRKETNGGYRGVDAQEFVRAYKLGLWSVRDPRYRETLRIIKDWSKYWNKDALSTDNDRLFRLGKAAMWWDGSWYISTINRDPMRKFEFGVFSLPGLTKATSQYAPGIVPRGVGGPASMQLCITNSAMKSGEVGLAVDFLQFITAPEHLGPLVAEAELFIPNCPNVKVNPILKPFARTLERGHTLFVGETGLTKEYDDQWVATAQSYLGGQMTLDQSIARLDRFIKPAVEGLIAANPQWRFDKKWNILPDKAVAQAGNAKSPSFVRYIPWTLFGLIGACLIGAFWFDSRSTSGGFWKKKGIYPFIIPSFLLLVVFNYYPVFSALYHSLFDWSGSGESVWLGVANFKTLFNDVVLGDSTVNAIKLLLVGIVISITVPLAAAELIFHLKNKRAQYVYRVLFLIPMVVPGVVMLLIWGFIYDYNMGLINQVLRTVGLSGYVQAWLGDPKIALYSLMFMGFPWIGGFALLVYYAGLQSIPVDVLDSCSLDGATGLRRIWSIDLPLVMSQLKLLVILGFIGGVQGFQTQLILTQGGPGWATDVPGLHMFKAATAYDHMGYACAIGVVLFIVILGLTYINMKYLKSSTEYEFK